LFLTKEKESVNFFLEKVNNSPGTILPIFAAAKKYEAELIDRGIKNIKKLAVVFNGKDVYVKEQTGS